MGRCFRKTQLEVLLIFWPPAPEPRMNFSMRCEGWIPRVSMRVSRAEFFSGEGRFMVGVGRGGLN